MFSWRSTQLHNEVNWNQWSLHNFRCGFKTKKRLRKSVWHRSQVVLVIIWEEAPPLRAQIKQQSVFEMETLAGNVAGFYMNMSSYPGGGMWSGSGLKKKTQSDVIITSQSHIFSNLVQLRLKFLFLVPLWVYRSHPGLWRPTGPNGSKRAPGGTAPGGRMSGMPLDGLNPERGYPDLSGSTIIPPPTPDLSKEAGDIFKNLQESFQKHLFLWKHYNKNSKWF